MTITLDIQSATGALFVDKKHDTGEAGPQRLRGLVNVHWTDDLPGGTLQGHAQIEIAACVQTEDFLDYYRMDFAGYSGDLFPQRDKPGENFPDFLGSVGPFQVIGWRRKSTNGSYPHIDLLITKAASPQTGLSPNFV